MSDYQLSLLETIELFLDQRLSAIKNFKKFKELEIDLKFLGLGGVRRGFADLVIYDTDTDEVHMFDYKMGFIEVDDAAENWQMIGYTLGLFKCFDTAKKVHINLLQPKCDMVSCHTYTSGDVNGLIAKVETLFEEVDEKEKHPHNITDKGCMFCQLKGKCEAYQSKGLSFMQESNVVVVSAPELSAIKKSAIDMTPAERGMAFSAIKIVEEWIKAKKSDITSCAQEGAEIDGFVLRKIAGKRSIEDASRVLTMVKDEYPQVDTNAFLALCKLSVTNFEKFYCDIVASTGSKMTKKDAKQLAEKVLASSGALVEEPGYSYLVKEKQ